MHIAISGAGSGIGYEFVKHFSTDDKNKIYAIDKFFPSDFNAGENVSQHTVDIASQDSIQAFADKLPSTPIDLFVHSAGVRGLVPPPKGENAPLIAGEQETIAMMDAATFERTFAINVTGSFMLIRALIPHLRPASKPRVVIMGSRMGSVSANKAGGGYAYRATKAGLNAIYKSFALDEPHLTWYNIHPGRVESRLTPHREEGAIEADESVRDMIKLFDHLGSADSGKFLDRFGNEIPW